MMQILLRLSIKSMLRFKTVCRSWHSLFGSSFFIERHLHFVDANTTYDYLLVNQNIKVVDSVIPLALLSTSTKQIVDIKDPLCPYPDGEYSSSHVRGPVNGIYCINIEYDNFDEMFVFWSPGHRQFHVVPPCPLEESRPITGIGFGLDTSKNSYKVITIQEIDLYSTYFYLYNLETNSWKELDLHEIMDDSLKKGKEPTNGSNELHWDQYVNKFDGVYLNGSCHWMVGSGSILSFDMETEVFRLSSEPQMIFPGWVISTLTIVNRCLAVICVIEPQGIAVSQKMSCVLDVCLMKEYGVEESWTRAYSITLSSSSPGRFLGIVGHEFFVLE